MKKNTKSQGFLEFYISFVHSSDYKDTFEKPITNSRTVIIHTRKCNRFLSIAQ